MNQPDGWITIGTKLDSKQLQRDLIKLENELKKYEKQAQKLTEQKAKIKTKIEFDDQDYRKKIKDLNRRQQEDYAKNTKNGYIINQEQIDMRYDRLRENLDLMHAKRVDQNNLRLEEIHQKMKENTEEQQRLNNKIEETTEELNKAKGSFDFKGTIDNIGNSITKVTKKVIRWGLAIFGVRSAYYFVRQAMSTIAQYDEQLATDIQYIRFALAMTLERFIKPLVEWVFKLLQYVNYLTMAWFNLNLFEKATVSAFNKSNKSAEKLKKTLAGFDEMNILNDNDSASSGGGIPSNDLSTLKEFKPPKWLEWIKDHGEEIKNIIIGIGIALGAIKFAKLLKWGSELTGLLGGLLQIGIIVIGVELLYTALTGRELISDINEIIKGLKDLKLIREEQNAQSKRSVKNTQHLIDTYNEVAKSTGVTKEQTDQYINTLLNGIETDNKLIDSMEEQKSWLGALNGDNKTLTETQKNYTKSIDIQLEELKKLYDSGQLNSDQTKLYTELLKKQIDKTMESSGKLAVNSKEYENNRTKVNELKGELEKITGKKYEVKTSIQTPNTSAFETKLRNLFNKVSNWFGNITVGFGFGSGGAGFRGAKGGIYYPKLAAGGIINMPGRGVPYHGATIGERGAEAVVPLTDSQQMALLGEAIGKYITINATIVNSMNGRVLNRELQKIQNQSNFATNGR